MGPNKVTLLVQFENYGGNWEVRIIGEESSHLLRPDMAYYPLEIEVPDEEVKLWEKKTNKGVTK